MEDRHTLTDAVKTLRRRVLQASGVGLAGLAGCADSTSTTPDRSPTRTSTATATATDTPTPTATATETATPTATPEDYDTTDVDAGAPLNTRLFAVPSTDPTIDGSLDDWDRSGMVRMPDEVGFGPTTENAAAFAVMYDDEAIYLGGRVEDPTPLENLNDPRANAQSAWEGDACQFRMVLDPDVPYPVPNEFGRGSAKSDSNKILHMLLWNYSGEDQANLQLTYGFGYVNPYYGDTEGVVPTDRFDAAYQRFEEDDGTTGYTFEYRIPWSVFHAEEAGGPPGPGDVVASTVQYNWGGPNGLNADGYKYDLLSEAGFPYQTPNVWGKLVFAEEGNVPEEVVRSGTTIPKPLPLEFEYEVPTGGEVTVALYDDADRLVRHVAAEAPRQAGTVTEKWDGLDAFERPLPPGDYTWKGLVHEPLDLEFVMSLHNSGTPPYKLDDGTGGWGANHGTPTTASAMGDRILLAWDVSEGPGGIIAVGGAGDKKWEGQIDPQFVAGDDSGERFFAAEDASAFGGAWSGAAVFDAANARPLVFEGGDRTTELPDAGDGDDKAVSGLAYAGGRIYTSFADLDLVAVNDADTGELLETHAVLSPQRLAADLNRALVVSGATEQVHDLSAQEPGDDAPPAVVTEALDDPRGIALGEGGRIYVANGGDRQNVTVHDEDGALMDEIGTPGGRPLMGEFDPDGMLEPGGITIDAEGYLWVAETLDAPKRFSVWDTRTRAFEEQFFGGCSYSDEPAIDPEEPSEAYAHNCLWDIDLDTGEYEIVSTLFRKENPNAPTLSTGHSTPPHVVTATNGRQYAWGEAAGVNGSFLYIRRGDTLEPILGIFRVAKEYGRIPWPPFPALSDHDAFPDGDYVWVDRNGDGLVQGDEVTRLDDPDVKDYNESIAYFSYVDAELNLIGSSGIWRPESIDDDGIPTYDFESGPDEFPAPGARDLTATEDAFYTMASQGRNDEPDDPPGFARYDRDGNLQWGFTNTTRWKKALSLGSGGPGDMFGPTATIDVAGEFTGVTSYFGDTKIVTTDGIYVGSVFRTGGDLGHDIRSVEVLEGTIVKPTGMDRYFHLGGDQDSRIVEITGLDTVERLDSGTFTVTEEMTERARRAFQQYEQAKAEAQSLALVRGRPALQKADGVTVRVDESNAFTAKLAYDEENLYVQYRVEAEAPLTNGVSDPQRLFIGGNCIDVQLTTGNADPEREEPAPGDVRLLFTRRDGEPFGMVYEPNVEGFSGDPIVFESPVDEEPFDRIDRFERFEMRHEETSTEFEATVTIPREAIGLELAPASTVRGDVGYIFDGSEGQAASARAYWSNDSFEANVVDDLPDESRLNPEHWGEIIVE